MEKTMRDQPDDQEIALRKRWLAVLSRAETSALEAAWTDCGVAHSYRFLRRPEIGLVMIRGDEEKHPFH
jgi:alpha-D-ribose 1-methylphosphonate 5-triphosphate synthase subunit PhnG